MAALPHAGIGPSSSDVRYWMPLLSCSTHFSIGFQSHFSIVLVASPICRIPNYHAPAMAVLVCRSVHTEVLDWCLFRFRLSVGLVLLTLSCWAFIVFIHSGSSQVRIWRDSGSIDLLLCGDIHSFLLYTARGAIMGTHQAEASLSKELAKSGEWPLPSVESHVQEETLEVGYLQSRSSTPHLDTAEIGRVLLPGTLPPGISARSRRGPPSIAHSLASPSISESGEGEDPSSVCSNCSPKALDRKH
jgi:hypothetical protein